MELMMKTNEETVMPLLYVHMYLYVQRVHSVSSCAGQVSRAECVQTAISGISAPCTTNGKCTVTWR